MLVGRAFVLNVDARAVVAVLALALSVSYAVLAGSATSTIRDPQEVVSAGFLEPGRVAHQPGFAPFPDDAVEADVRVANRTANGTAFATVEPWPHRDRVVRGPYAPEDPDLPAGLGANASDDEAGPPTVRPEHGSGSWVYLPPDAFDRAFGDLEGKSTQAYLGEDAPSPEGFEVAPAKGSGRFYVAGADQVTDSVHVLVAGMGLIAAVLSAGAIRLEMLARQSDLATLETLAGRGLVRRVVALRSLTLSAAGVGLGLGASAAGARLLSGLLPGLALDPPAGLVLEVGLVGLAAGTIAGTAAGWRELRHPVAERLGQRGTSVRRFPGPVRFLLVTPRAWLGVLAAALVTTAIVAVLAGAGGASSALLGQDERTVAVGRTQANPFTGSASRFLGQHATVLDDVTAASPETFAPTVLDGEPVMVRGANRDAWREVTGAELSSGGWPQRPAGATAGERLAERLDLAPGDTLTLPGAHRNVLRTLTVTGIHAGAGLADDALVTDLDTAGDLAGLAPDEVNVVRLRAPSPEAADRIDGEFGIEVADLTVAPPNPVPNTQARAHLSLVNLADEPRTRSLSLRADGELLASRTVEVAASSRDHATIAFTVPDVATLDLEVNPQRTVDTAPRSLVVQAPDPVPADETVAITVTNATGRPVPNATVAADHDPVGTTDERGRLEHRFTETGRVTLTASADERAGGTRLLVVDPAWIDEPHVVVERLSLGTPRTVEVDEAVYRAQVTLTNLGGQPFRGTIEATALDETVGQVDARLDSHETATLTTRLRLPLEASTVAVDGERFPVGPAAGDGDEDGEGPTVAALIEDEGSEAPSSTAASARETFLERFFTQLDPVLLVVVLLTFAHAALALGFAVLREVRERAAVADTLRHLGASREDVAARAARDALVSLTPPVAAGVGGALLGLALLQARGWPPAFGHTLPADLSAGLAVRMAGGLLAVGVATAALAAGGARPSPPRQGEAVPLDDLMGGSD